MEGTCMARLTAALFLTGGVVLFSSCGGSNNSSTATIPSAVLSTETLTGTLTPLGSASNNFTVNYAGGYSNASVTITSLTTVTGGIPQSITVGVGFGSTNVGVCTRSATYTNVAAPLNTELPTTGAPFIAGIYCVQLFDNPDSPTVLEPLNYTITLKHY
jgi:hypothetical protein